MKKHLFMGMVALCCSWPFISEAGPFQFDHAHGIVTGGAHIAVGDEWDGQAWTNQLDPESNGVVAGGSAQLNGVSTHGAASIEHTPIWSTSDTLQVGVGAGGRIEIPQGSYSYSSIGAGGSGRYTLSFSVDKPFRSNIRAFASFTNAVELPFGPFAEATLSLTCSDPLHYQVVYCWVKLGKTSDEDSQRIVDYTFRPELTYTLEVEFVGGFFEELPFIATGTSWFPWTYRMGVNAGITIEPFIKP